MTVTTMSFRNEIFDRSRLLVDLDEATEPGAPPSVLVVLGLRGLGETPAAEGLHPIVNELRGRLVAVVGESGSTYNTRTTELCAILDGARGVVSDVLDAIHDGFAAEAASAGVHVSIGFVDLPAEACDAPSALALADRRMTAAGGPSR